MNIKYVVGDATEPQGDGRKIIAHVCNDQGVWGAGFVLALSAKSRWPAHYYRYWAERGEAGNRFRLGNISLTPYRDPKVRVANMIAQHGLGPKDGVPPIRYLFLANCLLKLERICRDTGETVHMPRIGCGLAGGDWSRVSQLVQHFLCDRGVAVTIYDLKRNTGLVDRVAS